MNGGRRQNLSPPLARLVVSPLVLQLLLLPLLALAQQLGFAEQVRILQVSVQLAYIYTSQLAV